MDFLFPTAFPPPDPASRQAFSGLSALLKNNMGTKFLSFFEEIVQQKPILQRNEEQIAASLQKINQIIEEIHEHITRKLQSYEKDVFEIVREEMDSMNEQVRRLVRELNGKITQKNENEEVWFMTNELDYFKNEALKLFSENKELRVEVKILKKTINDYQLELESKDHLLQKIKKKSLKEKSLAKRVENAPKILLQSVRESAQANEEVGRKLRTHDPCHKKRMLTEISSMMRTQVEKEGSLEDQSRVNIRISNKSNSKFLCNNLNNSPILITLSDDNDRTVENIFPNLSGASQKTSKSRGNFMEFQPILIEESVRQCVDKSTQTNDIPELVSKKEQRFQQSDEETNEARLNLDLFRSGFKLNSTHRKTRRIEIPLRSSVDYQKKGMGQLRSMNNSFLKNRIEDSFMIKGRKQAHPSKKDSLF